MPTGVAELSGPNARADIDVPPGQVLDAMYGPLHFLLMVRHGKPAVEYAASLAAMLVRGFSPRAGDAKRGRGRSETPGINNLQKPIPANLLGGIRWCPWPSGLHGDLTGTRLFNHDVVGGKRVPNCLIQCDPGVGVSH